MRHRRLLHRKGALKVTHADLAAAPHQDVKDRQSHRMPEELEISAHALERVKIDARAPAGSAPRTPGSVWDLNDDTGRPLCHGGTLSNTSKFVNTFVSRRPGQYRQPLLAGADSKATNARAPADRVRASL
jgi:hypothetical protein